MLWYPERTVLGLDEHTQNEDMLRVLMLIYQKRALSSTRNRKLFKVELLLANASVYGEVIKFD